MSKYDRCSVCGYSEAGGSNDASPGENGRVFYRRPLYSYHDIMCDTCNDEIVEDLGEAHGKKEVSDLDKLPVTDGSVPTLDKEYDDDQEVYDWQEELDGDENFNRKQPFHDE